MAQTGVNVTLIAQLAVIGPAQLSLSAKSAAFAPLKLTLVTFSGCPGPRLVTVIVCAALLVPMAWPANDMAVGATCAFACTPVPLSATACGLPGALSAMDNVAVRVPLLTGANTRFTVHVAPG